MRGSVDVGDITRRYWPLWLIAGTVLLETAIFAGYLLHRQEIADHRADIYRRDICGILATIPGEVPPSIAQGRKDFARPGHPGDCRPIPGLTPKPTPVKVYINGKPATIIVNPPASTPRPSSSPSPSRTASPRPTPTPSRTPPPSPSPSPTCIHVKALRKSVCLQEIP